MDKKIRDPFQLSETVAISHPPMAGVPALLSAGFFSQSSFDLKEGEKERDKA